MTKTQIQAACDNALSNSKFQPDGFTTHCNEAVFSIFKQLDFDIFWNMEAKRIMMANEMVTWMKVCPLFKLVTIDEAIKASVDGVSLCVAGQQEAIHGHVCVLYPTDKTTFSGHWQQSVPMIANIGKTNGIMGLNYAFKDIPEIWQFLGE